MGGERVRGVNFRDPAFVGSVPFGAIFVSQSDCGNEDYYGGTYTVPLPPRTQEGDLLVLFGSGRGGADRTLTDASGWTRHYYADVNSETTYTLQTRRRGASEPPLYTWEFSGNIRGRFRIVAVRPSVTPPVPNEDRWANSATPTFGDAASYDAPSVTAGTNTLLACMVALSRGSSPNPDGDALPPAGMVSLGALRNVSGGSFHSQVVGVEVVAAGVVGVRSFGTPVNTTTVRMALSVAPDAA